jgi:hypothetical protein
MPSTVGTCPALPGLSPVGGKSVIARFDGGHLSSDGGLLVLREVERRLDVAQRLAACIADRAIRTVLCTGSMRSSASAC